MAPGSDTVAGSVVGALADHDDPLRRHDEGRTEPWQEVDDLFAGLEHGEQGRLDTVVRCGRSLDLGHRATRAAVRQLVNYR
jgi:hypothetical protein